MNGWRKSFNKIDNEKYQNSNIHVLETKYMKEMDLKLGTTPVTEVLGHQRLMKGW